MEFYVYLNPLLPKLIYETVKITQEMIFYGLSDLCTIHEGPHPLLINTENKIPYENFYPSSNQTSKNLIRSHTTHTLRGEERQATIFSHHLKVFYLFIASGYIILYIFRMLSTKGTFLYKV